MTGYRVTKYNPHYRAEDGRFLLNEWTSSSDIGRTFEGAILGVEEYLAVEDAYVESVERFMRAAGLTSLRGLNLGYRDINAPVTPPLTENMKECLAFLEGGARIAGAELISVIKLNLREIIWCRLEGDAGFYVHFGYDYYMYIGLHGPNFRTPALPVGMYAEVFETPYRAEE